MPNRLAQETSPYLQQHAGNPVDWYPWGPEALKLAQSSGKPILLSVGYSACHWCHVMAHESFEDKDVAAIMNGLFVNIKVDREERPDIDQIYQTAHAMITQRPGGWPLTMFLMPDQAPFFGGTYFPKEARYNLPGFPQLLKKVREYYDANQDEIRSQNAALLAALGRQGTRAAAHHAHFSYQPIDAALAQLAATFDRKHGGFGGAPKFPHPDSLELCLRQFSRTGDENALAMATVTLEKMASGGIYDQLGGGFARYSVDASWTIPHFEKMLYDNGPLLRLTADAWAISGNLAFKRVADETAAWLMREMQSPEGGYYSTLDADSEGEEGKFYVWTREEVRALLREDEYAVVASHYGLDRLPNFEERFWHLNALEPLKRVADVTGKPLEQCEKLLNSARAAMFAAREHRIRPGRDEKILVSWNALMIQGMAHAGRVTGRPEWIASARQALDFIKRVMWKNGRLLATQKDGKAHLNAYLDDYAFLLVALIELLQADFNSEDLAFAEDLGDILIEQFEDTAAGGFFFTSHDHEQLIQRSKSGHDNATPSGNGVAAFALQRLFHLTGEVRYGQAAERTLQLFYRQMADSVTGFSTLLMALEEALQPTRLVIVRGAAVDLAPWRDALRRCHLPQSIALFIPHGAPGLPPALAKPQAAHVNAWVCEGVTCLPPIDALPNLLATLKPGKVAGAKTD
jgi:uncharacterized protein YyaL (SSP411 family)